MRIARLCVVALLVLFPAAYGQTLTYSMGHRDVNALTTNDSFGDPHSVDGLEPAEVVAYASDVNFPFSGGSADTKWSLTPTSFSITTGAGANSRGTPLIYRAHGSASGRFSFHLSAPSDYTLVITSTGSASGSISGPAGTVPDGAGSLEAGDYFVGTNATADAPMYVFETGRYVSDVSSRTSLTFSLTPEPSAIAPLALAAGLLRRRRRS